MIQPIVSQCAAKYLHPSHTTSTSGAWAETAQRLDGRCAKPGRQMPAQTCLPYSVARTRERAKPATPPRTTQKTKLVTEAITTKACANEWGTGDLKLSG